VQISKKESMYLIAITLAKLTKAFISIFGLGAGDTWSGHISLKALPNILSHSDLWPTKGIVFISGTNGKTTTTKMLVHVLRQNGYSVTTNDSGANLLNGITASLALGSSLSGKARSDFGIFEVDEFTLPHLLKYKEPDVLVLLNLSRDQLDRYGETDIILDRWVNSFKNIKLKTHLVVNSEQKDFEKLTTAFKGEVSTFKSSSENAVREVATILNIKSVNLSEFRPAWGRGESVRHKNFSWKIYLAKNPASFDNNLEQELPENLLFIFNDNIPDGRDVSWIYDISTQKIFNSCKGKNIYVSGSRAYDMAVRLQYAGISIDRSKVIPDVREAVLFVENACSVKNAIAFPNYSAMLELRKILTGRSIL
jgi:UDP-N-acetylmuramyl tripeptide synthase